MSNFMNWLLTFIPSDNEPVAVATSSDASDEITCSVCDSGGDEETLLLCDGCDKAMHTECIGLDEVPEGNWYCKKCEKKGKKVICKNPETGSKVIVYCRVSSKGQDQPEYGRVGLMTQMNAIMEYCQQNGLIIDQSFDDVGSAQTTENLENRDKMIKKAKRNHMCILVYSVSRFSRNYRSGMNEIRELHKSGSFLYSVSEKISSYDRKFYTLLQQAEEMSQQLSRTMKDSFQRRRDQGIFIGRLPYGFTRVDKSITFKMDETKGLKMILSLHNNGESLNMIVNKLENAQIQSRTGEWTTQKVKRIIDIVTKDDAFIKLIKESLERDTTEMNNLCDGLKRL